MKPVAQHSRAMAGLAVFGSFTCVLLLMADAAHAQQGAHPPVERGPQPVLGSDFLIDDDDPENGVPSETERDAKPIDLGNYLMALSDKAEDAAKRGDHRSEAKFYGALAKAVPNRSVAFSKQCAAYEAAGLRDQAEQSCGEALRRAGVTVADFAHFVQVVLAQPGSLSKAQIAGADAAIAHLRAQASNLTVGAQLACDLGVRLDDAKRLTLCTSELRKRAPDDLKTISYEWVFALGRGDLPAAERAIEHAKRVGLRPEALARMEDATRAAAPSPWHALREKPALALFVAGGVAALIFLLSLAMRRRRAPRQVSA